MLGFLPFMVKPPQPVKTVKYCRESLLCAWHVDFWLSLWLWHISVVIDVTHMHIVVMMVIIWGTCARISILCTMCSSCQGRSQLFFAVFKFDGFLVLVCSSVYCYHIRLFFHHMFGFNFAMCNSFDHTFGSPASQATDCSDNIFLCTYRGIHYNFL